MAPPTAIIYIGGHGAKNTKDGPVQTRSAVDSKLLENVEHFSPVGYERDPVESDTLTRNSILTNTSIIPSLLVYLLCKITVDLKDFLSYFIVDSTKLDKQAGIHYASTQSERFQKKSPVDNKPLWFISMGEHRRTGEDDESTSLARMAAGDPIHFPLGVWCVLVHDAEGNVPQSYYNPKRYSTVDINPILFHPNTPNYTINNNCLRIIRESKLPGLKHDSELRRLLTAKKINIKDFIDPFKRSATPQARKYFNDLNITNSKNIPIFQKIIADNIDRATVRRTNAFSRRVDADPNDQWLIDNSLIVKDAQMHAALTKHSSLHDIIMICKALMPPGTIIQIIDTTCSSDYARQPLLSGVLTGYNPDEDSQIVFESLGRTLTASSSASASQSLASSPGSVSPPRRMSIGNYVTNYIGSWFEWWFPHRRQRTPSPPGDFTGVPAARLTVSSAARLPVSSAAPLPVSSAGSRKSHKNPKNRNKSKRKVRSTKRKTQKIRRRRK